MTSQTVLIPGHRYSCQFRFQSQRSLDRLAQFFYDQVLPHERKVSVLLESFGLPRRVIEDILADLLRRNFASLDAVHGEIRRMEDVRGRKLHQDGVGEILLWHDTITGTVLPFECVGHLTRAHGQEDEQLILAPRPTSDGRDETRGFEELPDQVLIDSVHSYRPELFIPHSPPGDLKDSRDSKDEWQPVSVARRRWGGPCNLFMPLYESKITLEDHQETIPFLVDSALRRGLTRLWSMALTRQKNRTLQDIGMVHTAILLAEDACPSIAQHDGGYIQSNQISRFVSSWVLSFRALITEVPCDSLSAAFQNAVELESNSRELLLSNFLSKSHCNVFSPIGDQSCLAAIWERTKSNLLIFTQAGPELNDAIRSLISTMCSSGEREFRQLIVVGPSVVDEVLGDRIQIQCRPYLNSERLDVYLRDNSEVFFGGCISLLSSAPLLSVHGGDIIMRYKQALLADTDKLMVTNDFGHSRFDDSSADMDFTKADDVRSEVYQLFDCIDSRIARCVRRSESLPADSKTLTLWRTDLDLGGAEELGDLVRPADKIARIWRDEVLPYQTFCRVLPDVSLVDVLFDALRIAGHGPHQRHLRIVLHDMPSLFCTASGLVQSRLMEALKMQSTIRLLISPNGVNTDRDLHFKRQLELFCQSLPSHRLKIQTLRYALPEAVTIDSDDGAEFIAFGTFKADSPLPTMIVESTRIAEQIAAWARD